MSVYALTLTFLSGLPAERRRHCTDADRRLQRVRHCSLRHGRELQRLHLLRRRQCPQACRLHGCLDMEGSINKKTSKYIISSGQRMISGALATAEVQITERVVGGTEVWRIQRPRRRRGESARIPQVQKRGALLGRQAHGRGLLAACAFGMVQNCRTAHGGD